jgi:NAD(P)-dependent dehydrogenase (short-subunit alcohol dehydrogenase family)
MPTVLITGANRGLGLEFARQYCGDGWEVIATAREPSDELRGLCSRVEQVDMLDLSTVAQLGERFDALDVVIANAGSMRPERAETGEDGEAWAELFKVNTIAPYLLAKSVLPNVAEVQGKLIAISSRMGSIGDSSGGYVPYRSSKAALNMAWHSLAIEARPDGVAAAVLNPGWVQTRMGGSSAPMSPEDSVSSMREVIAGLTLDQSGSFLDRTGTTIPW